MPGLIPSRDEIIGAARSGPDLLKEAQTFDPALAKRLEGESTVASKSLWGSAATMAITWVSGRYGFGWDPSFCALVAGAATLAVHAGIHWAINQPLIKLHFTTRPELVSHLDNRQIPPGPIS